MLDPANRDIEPSGIPKFSAGIEISDGQRPILHANAEGLVRSRTRDTVAVAHMKPELAEKYMARELDLIREEHARGDLEIPQTEGQTTEEALEKYVKDLFDEEAQSAYTTLVKAHYKDRDIINTLVELVGDDPEKKEQAMQLLRERISVGASIDVINERANRINTKRFSRPMTPVGMAAIKAVRLVTGVLKLGNSSKNPTAK